jgi:hypothetical protein
MTYKASELGIEAVCTHILVDGSTHSPPTLIGQSSPKVSIARIPRSHATQAITLENVNCRGAPRTSQRPSSG